MTDLTEDEAEVKCYTTKQVADLVQVTDESIRNWITNGSLPAIKINGFWRVRHLDLKKFLDDRHGDTSAQA